MKKFIKCLLVVLILPIAFLFVGCNAGAEAVSIKSITKTASNGITDTYTITYTNGKTEEFTITNGEQGVSISSIAKTDSVGLVDTYTITYTDRKTEQFTIVNGQDGENLYSNITINDLYNQVKDTKQEGYTLIDFIDEYLDIQIDTNALASSRALRSAVSIYVEHDISIVDYNTQTGYNPITGPTYGVKDSISWGAGSGVIYKLDKEKGDAYIITNYHVCFSADSQSSDGIATKFTTYLYGGESIDTADLYYLSYYNNENNNEDYSSNFEFDVEGKPIIDYGYGAIEAEYVGGSEKYDIAVLKVTNSDVLKNSDALEVEVYNSDLVDVGSTAIAVGNPGAGGIAVTNGIISIDSEYINVTIDKSPVSLREFRIDTPVNGGNSGGGLFDGFGRLIGIVNAKTTDTTSYENTGYAIPTNVATRVADSIMNMCDGETRKFKRVLLGVTIEIQSSKGYYDETTGTMKIAETIGVKSFESESLAKDIGQQVGDILTSVEIIKEDETIVIEIDRMFKMIDAMLLVREGDCIKFNYTRNGIAGSVTTPVLTSDNFIEMV
ncbi:MAG: trypsin-like peptidase domain-containing protein [Clostridia bacterium]|nr:trypsin-like peptidase domain-containing protein [Clostridia bacterium]